MIIYYTSDYFSDDIKRRRELRSVMQTNIQLNFFDKVIIFFENYNFYKDYKELDYLKQEIITVININSRQTFKDIFSHALSTFTNSIIIISNSDIQFDKTISRIHELSFNSKKIFSEKIEFCFIEQLVSSTSIIGEKVMYWSKLE